MEAAKSQLRDPAGVAMAARGDRPALATATASPAPGEATRLDEEVLADLTHEIRNQFHKLYYCTEVLRTSDADSPLGQGTPAEMLERTVQNLEEFISGALEYFRPIHLECVRMSGAELGAALEAILLDAAEGGRASVTLAAGVEAAFVAIDPSRFSSALQRAARLLSIAGRSAAQAFGIEARLRPVRRATGEVLEIRIEVPGSLGAGSVDQRHELVEWATVAKTLAAHGGGLARSDAAQAAPGCALWLPLCEVDSARRS